MFLAKPITPQFQEARCQQTAGLYVQLDKQAKQEIVQHAPRANTKKRWGLGNVRSVLTIRAHLLEALPSYPAPVRRGTQETTEDPALRVQKASSRKVLAKGHVNFVRWAHIKEKKDILRANVRGMPSAPALPALRARRGRLPRWEVLICLIVSVSLEELVPMEVYVPHVIQARIRETLDPHCVQHVHRERLPQQEVLDRRPAKTPEENFQVMPMQLFDWW